MQCLSEPRYRLGLPIMRTQKNWILAVSLLSVVLTGSSCEELIDSRTEISVVVPDVSALELDEAKKKLKSASSDFSVFVRDGLSDRSVIWESNWLVIDQTPSPGTLVEFTSKICLQVAKKNENTSTYSAEPMSECTDSMGFPPKSPADTATTTSIAALPLSKEESLMDLTESLSAQGRYASSDSNCGSFVFLISDDGSFHFYEWSETKWISQALYLGQHFPKTMKAVRSVDVTEDDVVDFLISLPTWDPLSKTRPMSGAIFAPIDCKWQWLTFKTTTGEDWYQLDFLSWDEKRGRIIAGDEVTDMFGSNYTGDRKIELRYFRFQKSTGDFRLSNEKPVGASSQNGITAVTSDPFAGLPIAVRDAVKASCNWPAADLAAAYGVSSKSKKRIAEAVAADFQEQYQKLVAPLCLQFIKE